MGRDSKRANAVDASNAFGCSTFTALNAKDIPAVVAAMVVMISLSPIFFSQSKLLAPLTVMISPSPMFSLQSKILASLIGSSMFS